MTFWNSRWRWCRWWGWSWHANKRTCWSRIRFVLTNLGVAVFERRLRKPWGTARLHWVRRTSFINKQPAPVHGRNIPTKVPSLLLPPPCDMLTLTGGPVALLYSPDEGTNTWRKLWSPQQLIWQLFSLLSPGVSRLVMENRDFPSFSYK